MKAARLSGRHATAIKLAAAALFTAAILLWGAGLNNEAEAQTAGAALEVNVGSAPVTLEMHSIPSVEPGINLSLREKRAAGLTGFSADRVVILLEPFGVPAAESFDANGYSLMDYLAGQGYDVWALDFRGFGGSGRAAAFSQPMMANPPQIHSADAVLDVDAAMQYICAQRGITRTNLLGWSWGGVVAADYAGRHPEKIERLVVYGGMHAFPLPSMTSTMEDPANPGVMKQLPAYQLATPSMSIGHWNMQSMGMVEHTAQAEAELSRIFLASDPTSGTRTPPSIRRPMGPMVDLYEIWSGRPIYDASLITAPTLFIRGDCDTFSDDPGYMASLSNASYKRYVEIPDATHWALYEDQPSVTLMNEIGSFLSERRPDLSLSLTGRYWGSYIDFLTRSLTVGYRVDNAGPSTGHNLIITGSLASDGVLPLTLLPKPLGELAPGAGKQFSIRYLVPSDLGRFRARVYATALDGGGLPYFYPGLPPAI